MKNWQQNIIFQQSNIKQALGRLNEIGIASNVLFVVSEDYALVGSVTDGDIRRGLLNNANITDSITGVMNSNCTRVFQHKMDNHFIRQCRSKGLKTIPVVDDSMKMVDILFLDEYQEIIPVDAVIMAGGKGERLLPLTKELPKPMLKVGEKPIIEHNVDRLIRFGVQHIHISINYLGDKICDYLSDGKEKGISIRYIKETAPLGTIGSLSLADSFVHDVVLLMNSDLLTNIDFGDLYSEFINSGADMAVATVPHHVDLPYAILELHENEVSSLKEKPRYTYFANAGIYLIKASLLEYLPRGEYYNATDLMEKVIADGRKLVHFPILGYWLDIGRMSDYHKAQEDIKHINW
jgi:dTDP-glucose pyrophosphorylase